MPTLTIIDGSGFIFRAFYALPPLTTPKGIPIWAVLGFCNMILKLCEEQSPTHWAVVFDKGRSAFRQAIFPEYKGHRPPPPTDLVSQFSIIKEACKALSIPIIEEDNIEADDFIASYTKLARSCGWDVVIVSSDKDMAQLADDHVLLLDPMKQKIFDKQAIEAAWDVPVEQIPFVQALTGDKSDNIMGIPGVGPKTAVDWVKRFGTLEDLILRCDELPIKKQQLVQTYANQVRICYQLVLLKNDIPLNLTLQDLLYHKPSSEFLESFVTRYHMEGLKNRLLRKGFILPIKEQVNLIDFHLIKIEDVVAIVFYYDQQHVIMGAGISCGPASYINREQIKKIFAESNNLYIIHDVKSFFHHMLLPENSDLIPNGKDIYDLFKFDDTMLLSYAVYGGHVSHDIGSVIERTTGEIYSKPESTEDYAKTAAALFRAWNVLKESLRDIHCTTIYSTVDIPLVPILACMENTGIFVDAAYLFQLSSQLASELSDLETQIYKLCGKTFMVSSPKQLGEILFDHLKWPGGKRGKAGAYQTSSDILESFAAKNFKLAKILLQWRQLSKLRNTYTESLAQQVNPKTSRLSTTYSMVKTSTGRLASINPNLQNIPARSVEGRKIRKAFQATEGNALLSLDYSQIELRLLAHMGKVKPLQEAFANGKDIHIQTASGLFGCLPFQVTNEMRRQAKTVNFGLIYGISAFGLSQQLGIAPKKAQEIIKAYFQLYPEISDYMEKNKNFAKQHGYVCTLWGRRCFIPQINNPNHLLRTASERQAINAPLQGTSADFTKRAMILVAKWIKAAGSNAKILLQIHDELVLEVPENNILEIGGHIKSIMESVAEISVPLEVNFKFGQTLDMDTQN